MSDTISEIRTVQVLRYVTPLREGGSLPAISDADDGRMYVIKFRGAGQGPKALIAELIGGEIARLAELNVPEIVFALLDEAYGRTEPDPEIQDLLKFSTGTNLGVQFLSRAATYDPSFYPVDGLLASKIVWLDCYLLNVDRTAKNTNMLIWKNQLWLIDHGACLYFHHSWQKYHEKALQPFNEAKKHILLPFADKLEEADDWFHQHLTEDLIKGIVDQVPDNWLLVDSPFSNTQENREAYLQFLLARLENSQNFVKHAIHERVAVV